ncbi:MAG: TetR/AcrR family transcriptional regulator [Thermoanaerobaculia bacterium]
MPKLWNKTIEAHRRAVHDATLEAAAVLVTEEGLSSVTMSRVARESGIGRATLYKYFPDVQSILMAWHGRQIARHLELLYQVGRRHGRPVDRLEAVLETYAFISHEHPSTDLATLLHRGEHVARAQQELHRFIEELVAESARAGEVREDVAPGELAKYCLHALTAAGNLPSKAAVRRLVAITLAGLRPAEPVRRRKQR